MKKLYALLSAIALTLTATAQSFTDGDFNFSVSGEGECMVTGTTLTTGDLNIPATATYDGETYKVTEIGYGAFQDLKSLNGTLTIPDGIKAIGGNAFYNCSGLTGSITIPNSVTTIGSYAFYQCEGFDGTLTLPENLTKIEDWTFGLCKNLTGNLTIPEGVTQIGSYAFYQCRSMDGTLSIPSTAIDIREYAFSECFKLKGNIALPEGMTELRSSAFNYCKALQSVSLPSTLLSIGSHAFYFCESLKGSLSIPNSVKTIEDGAFGGCSSIEKVILPEGLTKINDQLFCNCTSLAEINIPESVKTIGNNVFSGCESLQSITFPDGITSMGSLDFSNCKKLQSINIPPCVTDIPGNAFHSCAALTEITIPDGVKNIGGYAFYGCTSLTGITIPEGVESIGDYAFMGCNLFKEIIIPESVKSIGNEIITAGYNTDMGKPLMLEKVVFPSNVESFGTNHFQGCTALKSVTLPTSGMKIIPSNMFAQCSALESVNIPDGVTTIDYQAFDGCSALKEITIPESVTSIGNYAFANCKSLTEVVIPGSVKSIGDYAFQSCAGITDIWMKEGIETIGTYAFTSPALQTLIFPESVKKIGEINFNESKSLTQVIFPKEVEEIGSLNFSNCPQLKSVRLPEGLTELNSGAFSYSPALVAINLPTTLKTINSYAFSGCSALTALDLTNVENIGERALDGVGFTTLTLPSGLKSIDNYVGSFSPVIMEGTVPPTMTGAAFGTGDVAVLVPIGSRAAYTAAAGWKNYNIVSDGEFVADITLTEPGTFIERFIEEYGGSPALVTNLTVHGTLNESDIKIIGSNLTRLVEADLFDTDAKVIPASAFAGKKTLMRFTCPAGLEELGVQAFDGCTALDQFTIDFSRLTKLGARALPQSRMVYDITLGEQFESFVQNSDNGYWFPVFENLNIRSLDMSACTAVTELPNQVMLYAKGLYDLVLPPALEAIGWQAFHGSCGQLRELILPGTLKSIGYEAFTAYSNYGSQSSIAEGIEIPASVTEIGYRAFAGWDNLKYIKVAGTEPPAISSNGNITQGEQANPFLDADVEYCSLIVPTESIVKYLSAQYWGAFASLKPSIDVQAPEDVEIVMNVEETSADDTENNDPAEAATQSVSREAQATAAGVAIAGGEAAYVQEGSTVTFTINAIGDGNKIERVNYGGEDVTAQLQGNRFTTVASGRKTVLEIITTLSIDKPGNNDKPGEGDDNGDDNGDDDTTGIGNIGAEGADTVTVTAEGGEIIVNAPDAMPVEVYAITGARVRSTREHRISGLTRGIYIVRVGESTFKVAL